jgi:magnesium chelatase family protein
VIFWRAVLRVIMRRNMGQGNTDQIAASDGEQGAESRRGGDALAAVASGDEQRVEMVHGGVRAAHTSVFGFALRGIDAVPCEIEVDVSGQGLPRTTLTGLPDASVREAVERVQTAVANTGFAWPGGRVAINLAPADLRKEGPAFDVPMALSVLIASGALKRKKGARGFALGGMNGGVNGGMSDGMSDGVNRLANGGASRGACGDASGGISGVANTSAHASGFGRLLAAGELALDGRIRPIRGAICMAILAKELGFDAVLLPTENAAEASAVQGIRILAASSLAHAVSILSGAQDAPALQEKISVARDIAAIDFSRVRGQEAAKRALCVAAAGGHNVLLIGPAGSGKTLMARALPGILPPLDLASSMEVTRIHSCAGVLPPGDGLMRARPVRCPHHTASTAAMVGGGSNPRPGEVSLAHQGVLFLDEVAEFPRSVLEALREPLEDGFVTVSRARGTARFPARALLIAAMNPTARGDMGQGSRRAVEQYLSRLSGPVIDRIDLHVEVRAVSFAALSGTRAATSTAELREKVLVARARAVNRQGETPNARLVGVALDRVAVLDDESRSIVQQAMTELGLSARAYDKIRRVARTIADLDGAELIRAQDIAEAVQYRILDRFRPNSEPLMAGMGI